MEQKIKIFVSAYACEPNLGSEIGVGWHWVLEMSRYFDLWVLTRESNRGSIEGWMAEHGDELENPPTFLYYDLPKKWRFWKRGMRGVRLYYTLWQRLTNSMVKETMEQNGIEIYHLLTYGNALWGVSSYGQKRTFIWGPTSAGTSVASEFSKHYGFKNWAKELAQRVMAKTLKFNRGFKSRCKDAALILCKTEQTRLSVPEKYRDKAVVFTDVAVEPIDTSKYTQRTKDSKTRYLAVGRLESWRGFDLLVESFAKAVESKENIHLDILGSGSDKERIKSLIARYNLADKISLRGHVTREEYYQYMANCDVVVNPTLKEGAVTTAFDSLSFAKPLICIDSGGYTNYFGSDYSVVLPLRGRAEVIDDLSKAMVRLQDQSLREQFAERIVEVRDDFTWERKGERVRDIISSLSRC